MKKGGWAPIVFEQLDGITCDRIKTHPVIISLSDDIGYVFPEAHCSYTSDKFVYFDKEGVEHLPLPDCFGGGGEFYDRYISKNTFINFDNDTSISDDWKASGGITMENYKALLQFGEVVYLLLLWHKNKLNRNSQKYLVLQHHKHKENQLFA